MDNEPLVVEDGGLEPGKSPPPPLVENTPFSLKSQCVFDVACSFDAFKRSILPTVIRLTKNEPLVIDHSSLDPGKSSPLPLVQKCLVFDQIAVRFRCSGLIRRIYTSSFATFHSFDKE